MSCVQKIIVNLEVSFSGFESDKLYSISSDKWLESSEAMNVAVKQAQTAFPDLTFDEETKAFTDPNKNLVVKVSHVESYDSCDGFLVEEMVPTIILNDSDLEANDNEVQKYLIANKK